MSDTLEAKGKSLRAGVGDTIVTINQKKSLPNVFGEADIFGRTTPTGLITVQYLGANGGVAQAASPAAPIST
jgi:hypothetical protein